MALPPPAPARALRRWGRRTSLWRPASAQGKPSPCCVQVTFRGVRNGLPEAGAINWGALGPVKLGPPHS